MSTWPADADPLRVRDRPLVLLSAAAGAAAADRVGTALGRDHAGTEFVCVLDVEHADPAAVLPALARSVREVVFTDAAAAMRALDELGLGQDFVFTVPGLTGAADYALDALVRGDHGWEGTALIVIASPGRLDALATRLREPR